MDDLLSLPVPPLTNPTPPLHLSLRPIRRLRHILRARTRRQCCTRVRPSARSAWVWLLCTTTSGSIDWARDHSRVRTPFYPSVVAVHIDDGEKLFVTRDGCTWKHRLGVCEFFCSCQLTDGSCLSTSLDFSFPSTFLFCGVLPSSYSKARGHVYSYRFPFPSGFYHL